MSDNDLTEYEGRWWEPGSRVKTAGTLVFSRRNGLELRLLGVLNERKNRTTPFGRPSDVIHGATVDGKRVTLVETYQLSTNEARPHGFAYERWRVRIALIGAHIRTLQELAFHRVMAEFTGLLEWAGVRPLVFMPEGDGAHLVFTAPRAQAVSTSHGDVSLRVGATPRGEGLKRLEIEQAAYFDVTADRPRSLAEWERTVITPLQNLLTFATAAPSAIVRLDVFSPHNTFPFEPGESVELPISVLRAWLVDPAKQAPLGPRGDMLFTLEDSQQTFGDLINRWFVTSDRFHSVLNLFASVQYGPFMYTEHRFLNMAFACEIYHRRLVGKKFKFSARLSQLVKRHRAIMEPLLRRDESWADVVEATRKGIVHGDPVQQARGARNTELYKLGDELATLLKACLLEELGVPETNRIALFKRNRHYAWAVNEAKRGAET